AFSARSSMLLVRAAVRGALLWTGVKGFSSSKKHGEIAIASAELNIAHSEFLLDLTDASVSSMSDDAESWPAGKRLLLDGFSYDRISGGPTDAEKRLHWLALQPDFRPHPYRHFAMFLSKLGDDRGSREVLIAMESKRRKSESGWARRVWNDVLYHVT